LLEKVDFVHSYALSKIWYIASVLPITNVMEKKLNKHIGFFLWSEESFRIARSNCFLTPERGGIGLVHIRAKCDAIYLVTALRSLNNQGSMIFKEVLSHFLNLHGSVLPYNIS
jgi:hypothetical protein